MTRPDRKRAAILPFPARAQAGRPIAADDPSTRLLAALAALDTAVDRQRATVSVWQAALIGLKPIMNPIDTPIHTGQTRRIDPRAPIENPIDFHLDTARRL